MFFSNYRASARVRQQYQDRQRRNSLQQQHQLDGQGRRLEQDEGQKGSKLPRKYKENHLLRRHSQEQQRGEVVDEQIERREKTTQSDLPRKYRDKAEGDFTRPTKLQKTPKNAQQDQSQPAHEDTQSLPRRYPRRQLSCPTLEKESLQNQK